MHLLAPAQLRLGKPVLQLRQQVLANARDGGELLDVGLPKYDGRYIASDVSSRNCTIGPRSAQSGHHGSTCSLVVVAKLRSSPLRNACLRHGRTTSLSMRDSRSSGGRLASNDVSLPSDRHCPASEATRSAHTAAVAATPGPVTGPNRRAADAARCGVRRGGTRLRTAARLTVPPWRGRPAGRGRSSRPGSRRPRR